MEDKPTRFNKLVGNVPPMYFSDAKPTSSAKSPIPPNTV